ncbi:MAG: hypothetical protein EPO08_09175 [Rhodospirillaceae bacterium]|nr:MAG: hypothetical protein EPO08_09175 [Rhodospirillaceae bacterium]
MTHMKAALRDTSSMSSPGTPDELPELIAKLRQVQVEQSKPVGLRGKAETRENERLSALEDGAYAAIGRYKSKNLHEFHQKLSLMFEAVGDQLGGEVAVPLPHNGMVGGASGTELAEIVRGVRADAARLLNPPTVVARTDEIGSAATAADPAIAAMNDYLEKRAARDAADDGTSAYGGARGKAAQKAYDRAEARYLETEPTTIRGLIAKAQTLADELEWRSPGDDHIESFLKSLPAILLRLGQHGSSVPAAGGQIDDPVVNAARRLAWVKSKIEESDEIEKGLERLPHDDVPHTEGGAKLTCALLDLVPEFDDQERLYEEIMATQRASSIAGAMAQVGLVGVIVDRLDVEDDVENRHLLRMIERMISSAINVLQPISGVSLNDIGGSYLVRPDSLQLGNENWVDGLFARARAVIGSGSKA